jgi:hypothetical protein
MAAGLDVWTSPSLRWRASLSIVCATLLIVLVCLLGYFRFAYQSLAVPSQIEHPLFYVNGNAAQLIGTDATDYNARPGETVYVTLYWRALQPTTNNLMTYLHSTDSDLVRRNSTPADGVLPPSDWQPGQTWAERVPVTLPVDSEVQRVYPLVAGLYDMKADTPLPITDISGAEVGSPTVGRLIINGPSQNMSVDYTFGGIIGLAEPAVTRQGDQLTVCFQWLSIKPTHTDYQVFVHVLNASGGMVTQADVQPKSGQYPTSAWSAGEAIKDCVSLNMGPAPATGVHLAVGLYDLSTGVRLAVVDKSGAHLPEGQVALQP